MHATKRIALDCSLVCVGAGSGLAWGWPGANWLLGVSVLVPFAWSAARNRWIGALVLLAYYLCASRGLPAGTGIFFAESAPAWFGWALWFAVALLNAAAWGLFWSKSASRRALGILAAIAITALPPIGFIGWANPATAAGVLFPGMGFLGIALLLGLWSAGVLQKNAVALVLASVCVIANAVASSSAASSGLWSGMDTHYGRLGSASTDYMAAFGRIQSVQDLADAVPPSHVLVLPETILGIYTVATEGVLSGTARELAKKGSAVIVGAELPGERGTRRFDNALVVIDGKETRPMLERVPVPIGMWRPWDVDTFNAHPFGDGIATVAGKRVAYSICYEQLLVYPILVSFLHSPDLLIGAANDWWAKTTSIPEIQRQVLDTWGRLFNVPVVRATNI